MRPSRPPLRLPRARALAALVGVAALVALAAVVALVGPVAIARGELGGRPSPSRVIFPPQRLPISFSHAEHLARDKMDCAFCHENAPDSTSAADRLIPTEATCAVCHPIERDQPHKAVPAGQPDAKCSSCHVGWDGPSPASRAPPPVVVPRPNLRFNHQLHVSRQIRCVTCHGDLLARGVDLATRDDLPRMPLCLTCHDGKQASARCTTCHLSEPSGRVKTSYPEGERAPSGVLHGDAHNLGFRTEHARVARQKEAYCESCHSKDYCLDCHDGVQKPLDFHGGDYLTLHPLDARRQTLDCSGCHRLQTFCTGCHSRSGVSDDRRTSPFDRALGAPPGTPKLRSFHPRGWLKLAAGENLIGERAATHHSFQAQRNVKQCASCHREEFCLDCHGPRNRVDLSPVNPHPAGFGASAKCRSLAARSGRMCLRCHASASEARCL